MNDWLTVERGEAPLLVAFPHSGIGLADVADRFISPWRARLDTDWWVDKLYAFARDMGATTVRTAISRSVIDVNRDPGGASLYPGQATTELCPTTTFDGDPLYADETPDETEIARRREAWFAPYHAAIASELARLRARHERVVLYDAHSIRSHVPRLFDGALPHFSIGTNLGASCAPELAQRVAVVTEASAFTSVTDGRFRGGWTTRHYGRHVDGVHAIQMELAIRGYADEPDEISEASWPPPFDPDRAAPLAGVLRGVLDQCLAFATETRP